MITISMHDLMQLTSLAVSWGLQEHDKDIDPSRDKMKQNEARRFLKSRGIQPGMLRRWTEAGLLHPVKTGAAQNSPTVYSKTELRKVLYNIKLKKVCNDEKDFKSN